MRLDWNKTSKVITIVTVVVTLVFALYIMANGLGLVPELDFGAGAYFYADIPNHEKIVREDYFTTRVPYWVHVVLFLCWGWLMYRLWVYIDGKGDK